MTEEMIRKTILAHFRAKEIMKDLAPDEDFFDLGVSSLTVVELQISIEEELSLEVPTSDLMRASTVDGWIAIYVAKAG